MRTNFLSALLTLLPLAAGHGSVTSYKIMGTEYPGFQGFSPQYSPDTIQRSWSNYDPIFRVTDPKMTCNTGAVGKLSATVPAGENVTAIWAQWTHEQGYITVWLAKCASDFNSCTGKEGKWVQIDQAGLLGGPLTGTNWAAGIIYKTHQWTSMIPSNIEPGNYLIRHELVALHQSNTPQFYPECAQLTITGGGNAYPPAEFQKSIPGHLSQMDPSVNIDIYSSTATNYVIPGGTVWDGWTF